MAWETLHLDRTGKKYPVALVGDKPKYASFQILAAVLAAQPQLDGIAGAVYWPGEAGLVRVLVDDAGEADEGIIDTAMAAFAE